MSLDTDLHIAKGRPFPLGTSSYQEGINFALISSNANSVSLCLFDRATGAQLNTIALDPRKNKTGHIWHVYIKGLQESIIYAYNILTEGKEQLVGDPYAKSLNTSNLWGCTQRHNSFLLGEIITDEAFDWEDDTAPNLPLENLIIYEMHVRAFTQHSSSQVKRPGSYLGVIEKIPYLLKLGINAVELLPAFEFDECEYTKVNPINQSRLYNFWGYSSVNFFSPMNRYATESSKGAAIREFKMMVKELHRHNIEVILDVVYNHTGEGNETGPILSFKGIDKDVYYMTGGEGEYLNFTGCGNTFNTNHPVTLALIIDSLRYWVIEMHVDGFRFDLASIFSRGLDGMPVNLAPIISAITHDPILVHTKLIAEPWDAAGLYQVGNFAHETTRWSEWNGQYRDAVRKFLKGSSFDSGEFARRICGSDDLYHARGPTTSINFITAHDGFTLADLVSYNKKHNIENGEDNRDGTNDNESWNCGCEGPTNNKKICLLRDRQMRNFHLALMLSLGVPMLLMGDEYAHTKKGNNNTWCHDDELNWFLWDQLDSHADFFNFYSGLIHFRNTHALLKRASFLTPEDIEWHGIEPLQPVWYSDIPFIAFTLKGHEGGNDLYAAFNPHNSLSSVTLPAPPANKKWRWVVDTSALPPNDFFGDQTGPVVLAPIINMPPYSALLLEST